MTRWKTRQSEVTDQTINRTRKHEIKPFQTYIYCLITVRHPNAVTCSMLQQSFRYPARRHDCDPFANNKSTRRPYTSCPIWNLHCFHLLSASANPLDCFRLLTVLSDGGLHPRHQGLNCPIPYSASFRMSRVYQK